MKVKDFKINLMHILHCKRWNCVIFYLLIATYYFQFSIKVIFIKHSPLNISETIYFFYLN